MSTSRLPIILVNADERPLDGYIWHAAIDTYLRALRKTANVLPLVLPAFGQDWSSQDLTTLLQSVDGVMTTGSRSNLHPSAFGQTPTPSHEPFDRARDATTLPLSRMAVDQGVPLLAICRGHQDLNVAFGGTLATEIQDAPGRRDHRGGPYDMPKEERFALNHTIDIAQDGLLAKILGKPDVLVNSVHRQAIDRLGDGLRVEATADDGTIEAIGVKNAPAFALGVQWHPEHWAAQSPQADDVSTAIFTAFAEAARMRQAAP